MCKVLRKGKWMELTSERSRYMAPDEMFISSELLCSLSNFHSYLIRPAYFIAELLLKFERALLETIEWVNNITNSFPWNEVWFMRQFSLGLGTFFTTTLVLLLKRKSVTQYIGLKHRCSFKLWAHSSFCFDHIYFVPCIAHLQASCICTQIPLYRRPMDSFYLRIHVGFLFLFLLDRLQSAFKWNPKLSFQDHSFLSFA